MGKADERAYKTLIILISASVCILVIGCICILILTNGVSKEMKLRAELISHLDARRKAEASNNYKSQFLANMRSVVPQYRKYYNIVHGRLLKDSLWYIQKINQNLSKNKKG